MYIYVKVSLAPDMGPYMTLGKEFHFNNVESPLPKNACCQISMHSRQWFMRRRFLKDLSKFSLFCQPPLFEQIWIPIPQARFPPTLVEMGQVVLEKNSFKGKKLTDGWVPAEQIAFR